MSLFNEANVPLIKYLSQKRERRDNYNVKHHKELRQIITACKYRWIQKSDLNRKKNEQLFGEIKLKRILFGKQNKMKFNVWSFVCVFLRIMM